MKKVKEIIGFFLAVLLFFCEVAFAQVSVEAAIQWAEEQVGSNSDPCGKNPLHVWADMCMHFCGHAYGKIPSNIDSAEDGWDKDYPFLGERYATQYYEDIPRGALVFFDIGEDGHVGISIGNGLMIHAWTTGVRRESIANYSNLLGWRWPEGWTNDSPANQSDLNENYLPYRRVGYVAWYPANRSCMYACKWKYFDAAGNVFSSDSNEICSMRAEEMIAELGELSNWWDIIYGSSELTGTCSQ